MKVSVSNNFSTDRNFLDQQSQSGLSRLKEIEIINQSKKDISRFRPLYEAYYHQILNYIYQKVADKELAFDITSQVFLKAMTNIKSYKIQAVPFSAWLYRIAFNETMLFFRETKKMRSIVLDEKLITHIHEEINAFSKELILSSMESLIDRLDKKDIELIELRFYQDKSFKDIGFILGCSESTAKVRSHRLMRKLKQKLINQSRHEEL